MSSVKDKNLFVSKFEALRKRTKDFSEITHHPILEDPSSIAVFRTIVGVTINSFSKMIDIAYPWLYNLEKGKSRIGVRGAQNIAGRISLLFQKNAYEHGIDNVSKNYYALSNVKIKTNINTFIDRLRLADFNEFLIFLRKMKKVTYNFSQIYHVILGDSRILILFRIMLGLSQETFAIKLSLSKTTVEELENGYRIIKFPATAKRYASVIEKLIGNVDVETLKKSWAAWKNTRKILDSKAYNWKTMRHMRTEDFEKYFTQIKEETDDFSLMSADLFQKSPQLILIFRILLQKTQRDLERELGLKGYISNYECLRYKTLSRGRAELFADYFQFEFRSKKLHNLTQEEVLNRFRFVKESLFSHKNLTPHHFRVTEQESKVFRVLKNLELQGFQLFHNHNVLTKKGFINVDFVLVLDGKPTIFIECTNMHSVSGKFLYNLKRKIYEIDYRFIKIKSDYPDAKTMLVLEVHPDDFLVYRIKNFIKAKTAAIGDTFINDDLARILQLIHLEAYSIHDG